MAEFFFGREWELAELRRLIDERKDILLTGPRRIGKTTLAQHLLADLSAAKWQTALIDIGSCEDETRVVERLESETQQMRQRIFEFLKRARVDIAGYDFELKVSDCSWQERGLDRFRQLAEAPNGDR